MATTVRQEAPVVPLAPYEVNTLTKLFHHGVQRYDRPDAVLYRASDGWKPLSHREIFTRVESLTAGLHEMGILRGDRVAILSENRAEWLIADFAILSLGAVGVPIYTNLPPEQVAFILDDSEARAIFLSTREQMEKIESIRAKVPSLTAVIAFDEFAGDGDAVRLSQVERRGRERIEKGDFLGLEALSAEIAPDDLATLIYTSGTTGDPKGVMLSHDNIMSNVAATEQHRIFEIGPSTIGLSFLPLSHSFERMVDYYYWYAGASIAHVSNIDRLAEAMAEVRPHIIAAAPRVFEKIYTRVMGATGIQRAIVTWAKRVGEGAVEDRLSGRRSEPRGFAEKLADRLVFSKLRARTGDRIQGFVSGSAPLSPEIAKFFWAAGMPVYEGYGLTETSPVLTANKPGKVRLGTVGPPFPGTEIRIGPDGEILARGPQVMKGYFKNPAATAEVIDAEGWLHTGDVGEIDADGFLRITDRIKNIIVTAGGKNIAPAPLENVASLSPFVEQVLMIGDRRPFPSLLVVPDFENLAAWATQQGIKDVSPEALARDPRVHAHLERETLGRLAGFARFERPKKIAIVPEEFTVESGALTPSLKVKRRVVEDRYRDLIEEIYAGT